MTLHALLIAIDGYPIARHRLLGCVNDRDALADYLARRAGAALNLRTLTDGEATRQGVIDAFGHFRAARPGDVCVFYFSGHGSRAPAPRAFWHLDPDRMGESLVCHDSRTADGRDLMDKELAFLLWQATEGRQVHFTAIFDSCYSGAVSKAPGSRPRMAAPAGAGLPPEAYLGYEFYRRSLIDGETALTPPQGRFVHLAASEEFQTATELSIDGREHGVFTYSLLELLETRGDAISYHELMLAVQGRVAGRVADQTPQLLAAPADKALRFLGGALPPRPRHYVVDCRDGKWTLHAGRIQGLPAAGGALRLEDDTVIALTSVGLNRSVVAGLDGRDPRQSFRAFPLDLPLPRLRAAFAPGSDADGLAALRASVDRLPLTHLELAGDPADCRFWIHAAGGSYCLTMPGETRPLFRREPGYTAAAAASFLDDAERVAQWTLLRELENGPSSISDDELAVDLYRLTRGFPWDAADPDNAPADRLDWRLPHTFSYDDAGQEPGYRLRLRNTGNRTLYVSAVNLWNNVEISNAFLPYRRLEAGQEAWLLDKGSRSIPLAMDDAFRDWGITETREYIKLFISTDPHLNTDTYIQAGLPPDTAPAKGIRTGFAHPARPQTPDWTCRTIEQRIVRPAAPTPLPAGAPVTLPPGLRLTAPAGLGARARLMGPDAFPPGQAPPDDAPARCWGPGLAAESYALAPGWAGAPGPGVLELREVNGDISPERPLLLDLPQPPAAGDHIVALGYDAATAHFSFLGMTGTDGRLRLAALPPPSPAGGPQVPATVNVVFHRLTPPAPAPPALAWVDFGGEEGIRLLPDPSAVRSRVADANHIALLLPGIAGDARALAASLRLSGHSALTGAAGLWLAFDYDPLTTTPALAADALAAALERTGVSSDDEKRLTLLAHSAGALVARHLLEYGAGRGLADHLVLGGLPTPGGAWPSAAGLLDEALRGPATAKPFLPALLAWRRSGEPLPADWTTPLPAGADPGIPYTVLVPDYSDSTGPTLIPGSERWATPPRLLRVRAGFLDGLAELPADILFLHKNLKFNREQHTMNPNGE